MIKKHPKHFSPIPYPGGKQWAFEMILPYIPESAVETGVVSPFLGGGAMEINLANHDVPIYGYDVDVALINFWNFWIRDKKTVIETARNYIATLPREELKEHFDLIHSPGHLHSLEGASLYFLLRRAACFGIMSSSMLKPYEFCKIRKDFIVVEFRQRGSRESKHRKRSIRRLFPEHIWNSKYYNMKVNLSSFEKSLNIHKDAFAFIDPPYVSTRNDIYKQGYNSIDHFHLYNLLKNRENWILTYGDHPIIRSIYSGFNMLETNRNSGMKVGAGRKQHNQGRMSELIIFSHGLKPQNTKSKQFFISGIS